MTGADATGPKTWVRMGAMTITLQCARCIHFDRARQAEGIYRCAAFPDGRRRASRGRSCSRTTTIASRTPPPAASSSSRPEARRAGRRPRPAADGAHAADTREATAMARPTAVTGARERQRPHVAEAPRGPTVERIFTRHPAATLPPISPAVSPGSARRARLGRPGICRTAPFGAVRPRGPRGPAPSPDMCQVTAPETPRR